MLSTLLSYSRDDAEFATRLAADLRLAGTSVALAPLDGAGDDRRHDAAANALARCTAWLIVVSPAAVRSASFEIDVAVALGRGIPIVAIVCRDCELPARLRDVSLVDFRRDYEAGLRTLLARMAPAAAAPASVATPRDAPRAFTTPAWPAPGLDRTAPQRTPAVGDGRALRALGLTLLALALLGLMFVMSLPKLTVDPGDGWVAMLVGLPIDFVVAFAGVKVLKRGKQRSALSVQAALAQDRRAPVVYLRSFQDDAVAAQGSLAASTFGGGAIVGVFVSLLNAAGGVASEEEQLAEALRDVGPFVAIGKPGEKLPELGAARMYVQDSEWQDVVRSLMARAALVVLRAGKSDGLRWEIRTAAEMVRPERIVLLLPFEREQYEAFRSQAARSFPRLLPEYPAGKAQGAAGSVKAIVYFASDWTPHLLQPARFVRTPVKPWVLAFRATLRPVFDQLGVVVQRPKTSVAKILVLVVLVPLGAVVGLFLILGLVARLFN